MSRRFRVSTLLSLLFTSVGSLAFPFTGNASLASSLNIEIDGLKDRKGQICLSLFANGRGFPSRGDSALKNQCVKITAAPLLVTFRNLQPGSYAVAVLHDANNDRQANRNGLGIPIEGFGFSKNPAILTGPPKFSESVFLVAGPSTKVQIQLKYLLRG